MFARFFTYIVLLLTPRLVSAHLPYLDPYNSHSSFGSAFEFKDNVYSRALCTTTTCPPQYYQHNKTSYYGSQSYYSRYSWSKVYVGFGESLTFDFGLPYLPSLEYPPFRPTVYLIGDCLPGCEAFGYPKPQVLEYPTFDLPYGYYPKILRFHLADPGYQPTVFFEERLEVNLANYLNYTVPVTCAGTVFIVVESREKRIVEYYVAVGAKDGIPPGGDPDIDSLYEARHWAQGKNPAVGSYCKRKGYYERE